MTSTYNNIGVVGAGAWGTALALALAKSGHAVTLWVREKELGESMAQTRNNAAFLPKTFLPESISIINDMAELEDRQALVLAPPAQHLRSVCKLLSPVIGKRVPLIIASKGIELTSHLLMSEVASQELPDHPVFILTGPSFASEIARGLPAALTLASECENEKIALALSSPSFRLYTTDDIIGAQLGGALKNVLAIACGVAMGRSLGENARAALITRGLAEMVRLGAVLGARAETLMGLSGLGDVILTCTSLQSRNTSLGFALGQGKELEEIMASRNGVAEGLSTAAAALGLARRHGIDMPVVSSVDLILREKASIDDVISNLLSRPLRNETI